jgi:calcium-dependent protein kinase
MTSKEKNDLKEIFTTLDKNGDGMLTQEELIEGYKKFYNSEERAKAEVKYLMENADSDNSGYIDYSEFLMAMANKKKILSNDNVKRAFDLFDKVTLS